MSKIKLQNDEAMNHGILSGPMDGEFDLDESGILDDSGQIESGYIPQITAGYEYFEMNIKNAIFIRYVIMWSDGDLTGTHLVNVRIALDDGCNPMASGDLGDPIVNAGPEHYELIRQQVNSIGIIDGGQITGSCSAEYKYYPCGKQKITGEENGINCTPEYKYHSQMFNVVVPRNDQDED